jgi:2-iminobutanoate/2-iminopropanoate deaminase
MAHIVRHNPASAHAPSSGYSMGLEVSQHRRLLFVSGQVPQNSDGSVPEGFEAQCELAWRKVIRCSTPRASASNTSSRSIRT